MTLEAQYMTLWVMSVNGAILGAVYDMYRVVLRHWKFLRWAGPIFDFAFWIFSFALVFWSLMWANNGDLRIYVFIVMGIGLLLYRIFLRKAVVGSTVGIIMGIRFIFIQIYSVILFLFVRPAQWLFRIIISLLHAADHFLQTLERVILWPFKPLQKMLLWVGKLAFRLLKFVLRPLLKVIDPYMRPIWVKARPIIKPIYYKIRLVFKRGKGFWTKLTNWLLNRDDDKPKP